MQEDSEFGEEDESDVSEKVSPYVMRKSNTILIEYINNPWTFQDEYSEEISDEEDFSEAGLDSDESSGKDWSDLEREAAESDEERSGGEDRPRGRR